MKHHHCYECRAGEHDNYDEDLRFVVVIDPGDARGSNDFRKQPPRRGWLCETHLEAALDDGYVVKIAR